MHAKSLKNRKICTLKIPNTLGARIKTVLNVGSDPFKISETRSKSLSHLQGLYGRARREAGQFEVYFTIKKIAALVDRVLHVFVAHPTNDNRILRRH